VCADGDGQRLPVMSIAFFLAAESDPVAWRAPKKQCKSVCETWPSSCLVTAMVEKLLCDVVWGDLDYLLIDTPPGLSSQCMHSSVAS
jgi:Mrp family chromosome partitioning ATPase